MDQSEMSCVKKRYRLWMKKIFFGPLLGTQVKHISFLKHSVRGALRNRPANVITKLGLGISDHFGIHEDQLVKVGTIGRFRGV